MSPNREAQTDFYIQSKSNVRQVPQTFNEEPQNGQKEKIEQIAHILKEEDTNERAPRYITT